MRLALPEVVFRYGEFKRLDLAGAGLQSADFSGATLNAANFDRADLREANLTGASLAYARLNAAVLDGARLDHALLSGANMYSVSAQLTQANLDYARAAGALNCDRAIVVAEDSDRFGA